MQFPSRRAASPRRQSYCSYASAGVTAVNCRRAADSPGLDERGKLGQAADNRVRNGAVEWRDVAVRDQDCPHSDALRAVHVVIRPVSDEYATRWIAHTDRGHRGSEGLRVRLGAVDL